MNGNNPTDETIKAPLPGAGFSKQRITRAISTFVVGFVAGTAPFILIYCLPRLLTPGAPDHALPFVQLLLIGFVVGMTTAIIFTEQVNKKWQDVFVYALGIPALLIATVGDISGKMNTSAFQARMSAEVGAPPIAPTELDGDMEDVPISEIETEGNNPIGWLKSLVGSEAVAAQSDSTEGRVSPQGRQYLVTIGTYTDKDRAIEDYKKYQKRKFKTQEYINKDLNLVKISNKYLIVYWRGSDRSLANRVYKLLRINDPGVPVQLYQR
jgi:hypothetical protein